MSHPKCTLLLAHPDLCILFRAAAIPHASWREQATHLLIYINSIQHAQRLDQAQKMVSNTLLKNSLYSIK